ncbi:hypothetical protein B0H11DRAFT_2278830 [Mycena galericulata]|nr:hypothetical protein B0H11DRAFT_2278830 [Mycena galericulata]
MSSHYVSLPDEVPSSKLCSLSIEIRLNVGIPSPRSVPPPYSKSSEAQQGHDDSQVVRTGPVHVEEYGSHSRNWYFSTDWLVLTDNNLSMHGSAGQAPRTIISISDIAKLERTEVKSHGLILETTQGKKYLLTFKNDDDLYGWQDTIYLRSAGGSNPWNFKHNVHVAVDPLNGNYYTGLPDEWRKVGLLNSSLVRVVRTNK